MHRKQPLTERDKMAFQVVWSCHGSSLPEMDYFTRREAIRRAFKLTDEIHEIGRES